MIRTAIEIVLKGAVPNSMRRQEITEKVGTLRRGSTRSPSVGRELSTRILEDPHCPWRRVKRGKYEWKDKTQESAGRRSKNRPHTSSWEGSQTGRGTGRARQDPEQQTLLPAAADEKPFDPKNEKDACERIEQTIVQRRGQQGFRESLIAAYEGKCAITGCSIRDVLEAAHIVPYRGAHTNNISNGLLLRADLHTLFDCKLLAIDPATMEVLLAPDIRDGEYEKWCGRRIQRPKTPTVRPNTEALRTHLEACRNAWRKRRSIEVTR